MSCKGHDKLRSFWRSTLQGQSSCCFCAVVLLYIEKLRSYCFGLAGRLPNRDSGTPFYRILCYQSDSGGNNHYREAAIAAPYFLKKMIQGSYFLYPEGEWNTRGPEQIRTNVASFLGPANQCPCPEQDWAQPGVFQHAPCLHFYRRYLCGDRLPAHPPAG